MTRGGGRRTAVHGRAGGKPEAIARKQIVSEAARIMAEDGVRDFQLAKRKAARRLNLDETRNLPTNQEVDDAMREYVALFHADLPETLHHLRSVAAESMRLLADFSPRLVGSVLSGVVTKHTEIQLHIAANDLEEVLFFFADHHIPVEQSEKRVRLGGNRYVAFPSLRFVVDDTAINFLVFSPTEFREPPLDPVDGRPMTRANLKDLEFLLSAPYSPHL